MKKHFTPFDPKEADLKKDLQAVENTFLSDSNSSRDAFENFQQRYRKASKKLHNYRRDRGLDKTPSPKEKVLPKFSSHAPTPRSQKNFRDMKAKMDGHGQTALVAGAGLLGYEVLKNNINH